MAEVPAGKKLNGFTGELEDAAPLQLSPSPTDQRIIAAPPNDVDPETGEGGTPLVDLCREAVEASLNTDPYTEPEDHVGPSVQQTPLPGVNPLPVHAERETPHEDITVKPDVQYVDVPPTNTQAVADGAEVAPIELPDVDTAVRSPNASTDETQDESEVEPSAPDDEQPPSQTEDPQSDEGNQL